MMMRSSRLLAIAFLLVALAWAVGVTVTLWQVRRAAAVTEALLADYAHVKQDAITAMHGEGYYEELVAGRRP